jgi:hypothetical protein
MEKKWAPKQHEMEEKWEKAFPGLGMEEIVLSPADGKRLVQANEAALWAKITAASPNYGAKLKALLGQ